jgi:translation initiation factor 1A
MPKNTKGGNKAKSQKNSSGIQKNREIPSPEEEDDSHIAIVTKVQGDGRFLCQIIDKAGIQPQVYPVNLSKGVQFKYAKGIIITVGTYILISIREFQKDKGDIIFVYRDSEISYLLDNDYITLTNIEKQEDEEIQFSDVIENKEQKHDNNCIVFEDI